MIDLHAHLLPSVDDGSANIEESLKLLDVFEQEPLPSDSKLYDMDNVLIIPHKGGPTKDMYRHLTTGILGEMADFLLEGKEPVSTISKSRAFSMSFT